jgi:polyribonucleotide nucleotidyltransferase
VRVARINGEYIVNPPTSDIAAADIDLIVAASYDNIVMVEGEMKEVSENDMIEAISFAHKHIQIQCQAQKELAAMIEKANPKGSIVTNTMTRICIRH